jgi:hypothetical protein
MYNREQVLERISDLVFERSEKNDAGNQCDKTVARKTSYDLIDMILFALGDIILIAELQRPWIGKKIIRYKYIWLDDIIVCGKLNVIRFVWNLVFRYIDSEYLISTAIKLGDLNLVKFLYSIEIQFFNDIFEIAVDYKNAEIIRFLYTIDACDNNWNLMNIAAGTGSIELMQFFHEEGYEYNDLVFREACEYGHLEAVKFLYNMGIKGDSLAMYYAIESNHLDIIKFMVEIKMDYVDTLINLASSYGRLEICKFLYNSGFKFTSETIDCACMSSNLELVKYLYRNGLKFTDNAMKYAIKYDRLNIIEFLHGIGLPYPYDRLPKLSRKLIDMVLVKLHDIRIAAALCKLDAGKKIISYDKMGNNDDSIDNYNNDYFAVDNQDLKLLQFIYKSGVELKVDVSMYIAIELEHIEIIQYLYSLGIDCGYLVLQALYLNKVEVIKFFISVGFEFTHEDMLGIKALGYSELVAVFTNAGME